jgi:methyl-accepting chemotaxis protein
MRWNSILVKLMGAFAFILLLYSAMSYAYLGTTMKSEIRESASLKLRSDLAMAKAYVQLKYPGEWSLKDGKLYKGTALLQDQHELVDEIGQFTGDSITIFNGNLRVSTNVMSEEKRAIGTTASKEVEQKVLAEKQEFVGETLVLGKMHEAIYEPIKDAEGNVVGMFFVGMPSAPFERLVTDFQAKMMWLSAVAMIFCLGMSYLISRPTLQGLRLLAEGAAAVSKGDLTRRVALRSKDELGELAGTFELMRTRLSQMMSTLRDMSVNLKQNSDYLSEAAQQSEHASTEVASAVQSIAEGVTEQNDRLTVIRGQMQSTVLQMKLGSDTVHAALDDAEQSFAAAVRGSESISEASRHLYSIRDTLQSSSESMHRLNERSKEIEGIIGLIKQISDQTNLLALNASIEAARAGEQGRSFAVVAAEVRKLAEQTKAAALEINTLIQGVVEGTGLTTREMDASMLGIQEQLRYMTSGQSALGTILACTEDTRSKTMELQEVFLQVLERAQESMEAVEGIGRVVESTAAAAEQVAASAEEQTATVHEISSSSRGVRFIAGNLDRKVQEFKLSAATEFVSPEATGGG